MTNSRRRGGAQAALGQLEPRIRILGEINEVLSEPCSGSRRPLLAVGRLGPAVLVEAGLGRVGTAIGVAGGLDPEIRIHERRRRSLRALPETRPLHVAPAASLGPDPRAPVATRVDEKALPCDSCLCERRIE